MINCKWSSFSVSVVLITRPKWLCTLHCCLVWPGLKINGSTVQQQQRLQKCVRVNTSVGCIYLPIPAHHIAVWSCSDALKHAPLSQSVSQSGRQAVVIDWLRPGHRTPRVQADIECESIFQLTCSKCVSPKTLLLLSSWLGGWEIYGDQHIKWIGHLVQS